VNINYISKPEDYDVIIHGNTRFVIFEKTEDLSKYFFEKRLKNYQPEVVRDLLKIANIIYKNK
jgi:hypothetical protein